MLGKSKIFPNGGLMVMSPMLESVKHRLQQTQVIQLASLPGGATNLQGKQQIISKHWPKKNQT